MKRTKNIWLDGIMGVVAGDALGCPVQFLRRREIASRPQGPVTGMEGFGTYNMPPGTWTDDSSMTLAALESIIRTGGIDPDDIMNNFLKWEFDGAFSPFGYAFDEGNTCSGAIWNYRLTKDWHTCGRTDDHANGNGALMRIMPACLYCYEMQEAGRMTDREAVETVHLVSSLTHNHIRGKIACGLYYFMVRAILRARDEAENAGTEKTSLTALLQAGLDEGNAYYKKDITNLTHLACYGRLRDLTEFRSTPQDKIRSSGYVVDSLEAAVWSLINTDSLAEGLLKAVNLGHDSDTVAAIAGGLAGLYYGYEAIPEEWLMTIQKREWVEELINEKFT